MSPNPNTNQPPPPLVHKPWTPPPPVTLTVEPMTQPPTLSGSVDTLLRKPGQIVHEVEHGNRRLLGWLFVVLVASLLVFGVLLGSFSGGAQWWIVPLKVLAGTLASGLICLPSFYIFSSLGGAELRLRSAIGLLTATLALVGVVLVAFTPVVWLFTQATNSVPFIGFLAVAFWLIGLMFGFRMLFRAAPSYGFASTGHLWLWCLLFAMVTLQMTTSLRPFLGPAETILPTEKRFFLEHWSKAF